MCLGCRRLHFVVSSPTPETEDDEENEELPQPQLFDRPAPRPKTIIHPASSHEGIPAFVAYSVSANTPEDADMMTLRPAYAYVFYDTSPGAFRPARAEDLARSIIKGTYRNRSSCGLPDRVEVLAMPLPPLPESGSPHSAEDVGLDLVLSPESPWYARLAARASRDPQDTHCLQHSAACIYHHEREVQNRLAITDRAEAVSWYLPEGLSDAYYTRNIVVVDRLEDEPKNRPGLIRWQVVSWNPEHGQSRQNVEHYAGFVVCAANPGGSWVGPSGQPTATVVKPLFIGIAVMARVKTVLQKPCQLIAGSVLARNFLRLTSSMSDVAVMAGAVVGVVPVRADQEL